VFGMAQTLPPRVKLAPLMVCPACGTEMRLFGVESETPTRDLYTFECPNCGRIEARGVRVI
jgi:predicted RNA-binding Zn-ribbon protein involved in translation (DUF1610 family)